MSRFGLGSISQKLFGSKTTMPELTSLHEIVNLQYGTAIALKVYPTGGDGEKFDVSYADLAGNVASVSNAMESAGVGAGSIITLALPNSLEAVVCFAALQSLGGTALFVDPDASEESIASSAQSAGANVLISTKSEVCARIAQAMSLIHWTVESSVGAAEVVLDTQNGTISTPASGTKDPSEPAAIISSRSQGIPTLLPVSHTVVSSAAKAFTTTYNLDQTNCTLLAHPVHSVHGLLHLVSSLSSGGCLILTPGESFVVSKLPELIQQDGMNYLCVPAVDVMKICTYTREVGSDASALEFVRSCPGTIKTEVQTLEEVLKTSILEAYGPAQASGIATAVVKEDKAVGTQGKPVAGCQLRIFDDNKEVSPVDVEGDIAVAGEMVAPVGYIGQSTLNEAALYTDAEGVVWFLTGDRGQIDSEGNLKVAYDLLSQTSVLSAAGAASFDLESRKMTEVAGASARAAIFASSFPQKESDAMRKELEGADLTTSALVTSALEGEDQAYTGLVSGDMLRKQALVLESLKDESRRMVAEKDAEDLRRANHELDLRAGRMNSEREFMEDKEVGIRKKISQLISLSAAQQQFDEETRGDLLAKLSEVSRLQAKYQEEFHNDHKRSVDELATELNQLDAEIGQLSEVIFLAKTAMLSDKSSQPAIVHLQTEDVENTAISAATQAKEAEQNAKDAVGTTSKTNGMLAEAGTLAVGAGAAAASAAVLANKSADAAHDAGYLVPSRPERIVQEFQAQVPTGLDSVEKRVRVEMADIERTMAMHPSVEKAVAFPVSDGSSAPEIAVAVKTKPGARVTDKWLKVHAQSILPTIAVPSKWYSISEIPVGATREDIASSNELVEFAAPAQATAMAV
ncbi:hypothetical protein NDN08_000552 [Rhodosorus marinus]|uniref:AMP-dependent synthetase/ligase domain-containing protein n=1 Tax=Rhodosorus marinus TaxID=101924 RepID=A0AAV8URY2_9RHOD|nr:hypothetical protein NDN08_000552 [Rhodosorus marinus]